MKTFIAGPNEENVRLSRFVESVTQNMPRSLLYKSFRNKRIKVNEKKGAPEDRLKQGDRIELYINDEFFPQQPLRPAKPPRRQPAVQVVYEDENIAVLYKPAHLLCHSDRTGDANLVDAFIAYLTEKGEYSPAAENRFSPAICNRLDRGTEGLVIAAKNYAALRDMNALIQQNHLRKEYLTVTVGAPPAGEHHAWWQHHPSRNKVSIHAHPNESRKEIITAVSVLKTAGPFALCRVHLITGRTHQIRAHLAYLGHPVLGDVKYGNAKMNERTGLRSQLLCAQRITFENVPAESSLHYLSGKVVKLSAPAILETFEKLSAAPSSGNGPKVPPAPSRSIR